MLRNCMDRGMAKETVYDAAFREMISREEIPWLRKLREEAFAHFLASGFPNPKNEEWKYTNVALAVAGDWSVVSDLQGQSLKADDEVSQGLLKQFDFKRNGFAALNLAFAPISVLRITKETKVAEPIIFDFSAGVNEANFQHLLIIAEAGSKTTIIETFESIARSFTNATIQILVGDNAHVTHYRLQKESVEALHIGITEVQLGRGSFYDSTNINLGGALSRHDAHLKFNAEGAEAYVDGLYLLGDGQHHDTHSTIDHAVPNCVSHQNYKGILDGKSRGVFNGKVFVRENASGTDAQQSNKNLLLSNDARVDTKPQLEIFNDDVKCSHGATVGQLEEEELFYLLSRGLNESLARNLLTYGFAEEIVNKIGVESIKKDLDDAVLNRLHANLEM